MKKITVLLLVFFLAACTSVTGLRDVAGLSCPQTGFLQGHDRAEFTVGDVVYKTALTALDGTCYFPNKNEVEITTRFYVVVKAVDAPMATAKISIPYVAAVLDRQENLLLSQSFSAKIEITGGEGQAMQELTQRIPVENAKAAGGYKLVYSFPSE